MRVNRSRARRDGGGNGSFWLSFSDLMSCLVLIIILVMFYIIYQYFNLAEVNEAEIARREYQLDQAQTELETQQSALSEAEKKMVSQQILLDAKQKELDSAEDVLESQRTELAEAQTRLDELDAQLTAQQSELTQAQALLESQQGELSTAQEQLASQQSELAEAQAQLATREGELSAAQGQLASQQSELDSARQALQDQQVQIEQLVGMRTRIITSLSDALRSSNISATVDSSTGSIALESDVLFATGAYDLTQRGKGFIDEFLPVYLDVLFSEEYRPYVSEIIIEGHTDSVGTYLSNLQLSQQRALAVASYVLGDSPAVSPDMKNVLRDVVTVNGRSFSDRIFGPDGLEDMDASRRVVFKFRLTDEQMIQQLRTILEGVDEAAAE